LEPEALQQNDPSLVATASITEPLQPVQTDGNAAANDGSDSNDDNDKKDKDRGRGRDRGRNKNKDNLPESTERALIAVSSIGMYDSCLMQCRELSN
jgi:hypothetical protein